MNLNSRQATKNFKWAKGECFMKMAQLLKQCTTTKICARLNEIYFSCVLCLLLFNIVDVTGHKEAAGDGRVST